MHLLALHKPARLDGTGMVPAGMLSLQDGRIGLCSVSGMAVFLLHVLHTGHIPNL